MQTIYDLKAQTSRQEVSDDIQMGMDTNLDDSYPENATESEYDWDASSALAEPPSRSHSPMPPSPTSFSAIDDQGFNDNQYSQSPNLVTYTEGEPSNEQGIIDWNHNCMKSSQWRSEQSPEIESIHMLASLDPNMSLTPTSTEPLSYFGHVPEELPSTDMEL